MGNINQEIIRNIMGGMVTNKWDLISEIKSAELGMQVT